MWPRRLAVVVLWVLKDCAQRLCTHSPFMMRVHSVVPIVGSVLVYWIAYECFLTSYADMLLITKRVLIFLTSFGLNLGDNFRNSWEVGMGGDGNQGGFAEKQGCDCRTRPGACSYMECGYDEIEWSEGGHQSLPGEAEACVLQAVMIRFRYHTSTYLKIKRNKVCLNTICGSIWRNILSCQGKCLFSVELWRHFSMSIELTKVVSVDMSNEPRVLLFCYLFQSVRRLISSARLHHIHGSECPSCPNPQMSSSSRWLFGIVSPLQDENLNC